MKVFKTLGVIFLLMALVVGGIAYYLFQNMDALLKDAIETYGTEAVGTKVSLDDIQVELREGRVSLTGLVIDNPPGYTSDYAMSLGKAVVQLNYDSIQKKVIILDEIMVDAPSIIAEEKNMKDINLKDLSDNLKKGTSEEVDPVPEEQEPTADPSNATLLMVRKFTFSNANLSLISSEYGDRNMVMPTINVADLGAPDGVTPDVLAQQMMRQILDQANKMIKKEVKKAAKKKVQEKAEKELEKHLSDDDKEKLEGLKSLFKKD